MQPLQAVLALSALAQETRLAVFRALVAHGPDGMSAGLIAERLSVPPSSLTFHLQQLLHAGLVTQRRVGRQIIYAAEYGAMNDLMSYLTENCCGGASISGGCAPSEICAPPQTRPVKTRRSAS